MWKEETQNFIKQLLELTSPLRQQLGANSVYTKGSSESNKKNISAKNKFIFNDLPDPVSTSPDNHQGSPDNKPESPGNKQESPGNNQGPPDNKQGSPDNKQVSPDNKQGSPDNKQESPGNNQVSPDNKQGSPGNNQGPPDNKQGSPDNKQGPPDNKQWSPDNKQGPPDNKQESPGNNQVSPDNKQGSPDNKQGSPDNKQGSPNNKQGSPDNKQGSPDNKQGSPDNKQGSPDNKQVPPDHKQVSPDNKRRPSDGKLETPEHESPVHQEDGGDFDCEEELVAVERLTRQQSVNDRQRNARIPAEVPPRPEPQPDPPLMNVWNYKLIAFTCLVVVLAISVYWVSTVKIFRGIPDRPAGDRQGMSPKDFPKQSTRFVAEEEFQCKISDRPAEDIGNFCNKLPSDRRFCEDIKSDVEAVVDKRSKCILHYRPWLNHKREIAQNLFNRLECALTGHNQILSISGSEMEGEGLHTELYTKMSEWFASDSRVAVIYDVERLNKESGQVIRRVCDEIHTKYAGRYLVLLSNYNKRRDIPENHWTYEMIKRSAAEEEFRCKISDNSAEDIENFCNKLTSNKEFCESIKSKIEELVKKRSMYVLHNRPWLNNKREIAQKLFDRIECALTGHNQILSISGNEMEGEGHHTELYTKLSEWFDSGRKVAVIYDVERLNKESGLVISRFCDEIYTKYPGRYLALLSNYNKRTDIPENHWIYEMIKDWKPT